MFPLLKFVFSFSSSEKKIFRSLKNMLGFYPDNLAIYQQALRHSSAAKEIKEGVKDSNERLEYLGDAVLSTIVAHYLFQLFPFKDEGFLTKIRSRIVSRTHLNKLAVKMGLNQIITSNLEIHPKNNSINGDAFEALIGAIYLDKGYNFTKKFILQRILRPHVDMDDIENIETDFKSRLIEWAQKEKKEAKFTVVEEKNSANEKEFFVQLLIENEVKGNGKHFSKKRAEQIAAEQACKEIGAI
ncbi:MAG TPA: ribonuclease III [Bacteroidia bacterium]|nr:ribonuclease III [Bacteroidia bacterium]